MPVRASAVLARRKPKYLRRGLPEFGPDLKVKVQKLGAYSVGRPSRRGKVRRFTFDSHRRLVQVLRSTADLWTGTCTLTYPEKFPADGRKVKRHLDAFLRYLRRRDIAYMWVLEFQKRGAPHFHLLLNGWLPRDRWEKDGRQVAAGTPGAVLARRGIESEWYGIVGSGEEKHLRAGTEIHAIQSPAHAKDYISKRAEQLLDYMGKLDQKDVPDCYVNVGRFWGCSRMLEKVAFMSEGVYQDVKARLAPLVKGYESKCADWGFKWEWKGAGFVYIGGQDLFTSMLRQAAAIDSGVDVWRAWDGRDPAQEDFLARAHERLKKLDAERRARRRKFCDGKFVTPEQRLKREGQFTLDGRFEETYGRGAWI